jgi:hypothetical protein
LKNALAYFNSGVVDVNLDVGGLAPGPNPTTSTYNATVSLARFKSKKCSTLKNAVAYFNSGVVAANSEVVGLAPGLCCPPRSPESLQRRSVSFFGFVLVGIETKTPKRDKRVAFSPVGSIVQIPFAIVSTPFTNFARKLEVAFDMLIVFRLINKSALMGKKQWRQILILILKFNSKR